MAKRKIAIRCEYMHHVREPVVEIDEEEESILTVDHAGSSWFIYIGRWVDD